METEDHHECTEGVLAGMLGANMHSILFPVRLG
jgi:hypothetical protein